MVRGMIKATVAVLASAILLAACGSGDVGESPEAPVEIEELAGSDLSLLKLSQSAAQRLDIRTTTVETAGDGMVVPSAAVIIDPEGVYWVYENPEPLVYVRREIRPVHEEDHQAFFEVGPSVGSLVVTRGVPELYGAEFGIGK